MKLAAIKA